MLTRVEISSSAFLHNVNLFKRLAGNSRFMAVIKSNAYGHGFLETARILSGDVDFFGVNALSEARLLRTVDESTPVLIMGAVDFDTESFREEIERNEQNIHFVISTIDSLERLQQSWPGAPFHVKVDTGMSRLGLHGEKFQEMLDFLNKHHEYNWTGLMTHFSNVEDVTHQTYANQQLESFRDAMDRARSVTGERNVLYHAAASAAAMILPESRLDMIRVGISLYGLWPSNASRVSLLHLSGELPVLMPVMRWITKVVHLNRVKSGHYVGYGCTYRTHVDTTIAVLPVGYFEGYDRGLSNHGYVLIQGKRAMVLGRVCMNMIMVDVSHIENIRVGDEATLLGGDGDEFFGADDMAGLLDTINYEVVTRIERGIPRVVIDS